MSKVNTKQVEAVEEVVENEPAGKNAVTVEMEDGRKVAFAGKKRLVKASTFDEHGHVTTRFDFRNGRVINFNIPHALMAKFAAHGAEQKIGDVTAGEDNLDDAVLAVEKVVEQLSKGEWNATRAAGGMAGTSILMRAMIELTGKSADEIKAFLSDKSQAEKIALRNNPKIAPIVAKLEAAKVKTSAVDTDALLAQLG